MTFAAADFLQTEGVPEVGQRERVYFRLTQRDGPDRLNLIWKNVQTVDLVRCVSDLASVSDVPPEPHPEDVLGEFAGPLPIPTGLWVVAGGDCEAPANSFWRVYDGVGLFGSQSQACEIHDVAQEGPRYLIEQNCVATYDGSKTTVRDIVEIQASRRFGLIEDGEATM